MDTIRQCHKFLKFEFLSVTAAVFQLLFDEPTNNGRRRHLSARPRPPVSPPPPLSTGSWTSVLLRTRSDVMSAAAPMNTRALSTGKVFTSESLLRAPRPPESAV